MSLKSASVLIFLVRIEKSGFCSPCSLQKIIFALSESHKRMTGWEMEGCQVFPGACSPGGDLQALVLLSPEVWGITWPCDSKWFPPLSGLPNCLVSRVSSERPESGPVLKPKPAASLNGEGDMLWARFSVEFMLLEFVGWPSLLVPMSLTLSMIFAPTYFKLFMFIGSIVVHPLHSLTPSFVAKMVSQLLGRRASDFSA